MKNKQEQIKKCNLCGHDILNYNGTCECCGWVQQTNLDNPHFTIVK